MTTSRKNRQPRLCILNLLVIAEKLCLDLDLDPYSSKYLCRRVKSEGVSFLTVTLPKFAKRLVACIETGYFSVKSNAADLSHFRWKGHFPLFLRRFVIQIFDLQTGVLLPDPSAASLQKIRQLCEYCFKLALDYTQKQLSKAEEKFLADEKEVLGSGQIDNCFVEDLRKIFEYLFPFMRDATYEEILHWCPPRSGPGTFSMCDGKDEYYRGPWFSRKTFDYRRLSRDDDPGLFRPIKSAPLPEIVPDINFFSEVLFVSKDSRGPRTIIREPYNHLRLQMSFFDFASRALNLESRGRINFQSQEVNRSLAQASSVDKLFATADLSDASDMVSYVVVSRILRNSKGLISLLERSRVRQTRLPNGELITLRKLAGMGSGLTFASLSLLIYLVSVKMILDKSRRTETLVSASRKVYVYGDDLIVPSKYFPYLEHYLSKVGLRLNKAKSFSKSNFRESCGGDYFNGVEVSPCRLKLSSASKLLYYNGNLLVYGDAGVLQLERHCRELIDKGLTNLANYYYKQLESILGPLPLVTRDSHALGRMVEGPIYHATTAAGTLKPLKAWVPVSVRRDCSSFQNPYVLLASSLKRLRAHRKSFWWERNLPCNGIEIDSVTVPREVRLRKRNVVSYSVGYDLDGLRKTSTGWYF